MSNAHAHPGDDHHHDDEGAEYHASYRGYLIGFVLSVALTAIPFWLVMAKVLPTPGLTALVILGFAAVQVVVHMVYFLHMNAKVEQGWSLLSLVFTIVLVVIMLAGSIWVMHHLNTNMMPVHDMRTLP
ncbi:MAG: cytochrome o ubiquinol oxidase subunit IV [Burkholderiaceae bacterium]|nr:cytochrome o ubiquinol oxidase subunit IV [Burkholderiaceae bacterium]